MRSASSKTLWLLLSAGAAFAVLAWSAERGPAGAVVLAPAVRAVDAPPPLFVARLLQLELGQVRGQSTGIDTVCTPMPCTAADVAQAQTEESQRQDAIRPGAATPPRTVAELPGVASLVAWKNAAAQLCFEDARTTGGGGSVFGPCVHDRTQPCTALCVVTDGSAANGAPVTYLLAGTVDGNATALRVTTAHTGTTYLLRGDPLLPGTGRRIVLLDLGRDDYRVLELLRGRTVVDSRTLPAVQAAFEDCQAAHPDMNDLKACLAGGAAIVPQPSFP